MSDVQTSFLEVFDGLVASAPDAPAVEFHDRSLSYRELDDRARALTAALVRRGVGRGAVVGMAVGPLPELPVAVLGILRAGAAWLPLDPAYPAQRLRYMIADSEMRLLIAEPATGAEPAYGVDTIGPAQPFADPMPTTPIAEDDLAYVIYTSGTTGMPKGVGVTHGGLANLIAAQTTAFAVAPGARVLQFAPTSFDASVFEMTMALAAGATLVLAPRTALGAGPALADLLRARRISHLTLPPSVLATLPDPADPGAALPDLAVLVCAGESLPEPLARKWLPGRRLFNAYGPTETTVWATLAELTADSGKPAIGVAIRGARTAVVDGRQRRVPAGTAGELLVGGNGVARGYLGRPGLTARRFVPDPDSDVPGARRYRTGDLVVEHPDGALEFLGRVDNQVKIRGVRIEPEEVARCLADNAEVTDAVVVARDLGRGPELFGYVTGPTAEPDVLLDWLRERLPAHSVPVAVVRLAEMPLTPSGKVDRAALPVPAPRAAPGGRAPTTPTERTVAAILAELLSVESVGADEEFFALGGNSLLAGRLAARVRAELGRELHLQLIYQSPTVAGMAALIDSGRAGVTIPPVQATTDYGPAPLAFPQERVWFLESLAPGNLAYNAQATLRLRGSLVAETLQATLTEIVRRHEVFRCAFVAEAGTPTQRPLPPMPVPLPVVDLAALPEGERERRAEEIVAETVRDPFDLADPPLARWVLIRHSAEDHTLVHVEHHLVHDGWSFALFLRELQAIYPALLSGVTPPPAQHSVRYTDFARWQRGWLRGEVLDAQLAYWTDELAGCPAALELPTDRPRPHSQSFRGAALRVDLPAELCGRLRDYARSQGVTLFTAMLSGFAAVISRHAGQREVVIGSGVANRRLAELESVIGMIVNTLPLRVDLSGHPGFDELVRRAHDTVGRAAQWQDIPLERLVDALKLPRDPGRNPLFQVMFSFHDSQVPDLDFAGVRGVVRERHNGSAKTDINVVVIPRAEQRAGRGVLDDADPITLIWEYATDLFDADTMRDLVDRYLRLLSAAVAEPAVPVERLALLTRAERAGVLRGSAGPVTPFPAERTIPELFADQVAARPDQPAVVHGGQSYTYRELDERTNQIACLLRARGIGPDVPVGVLLERGADLITVLLAVLKAGGAYVPLDPGYPAERLAAMVADVAAPVVVTRAALRALADAPCVLTLDEIGAEPNAAAAPLTARPGSLAYILFTSGSTGRPKGVMVEHRSVLRLVCRTDYVDFGPGERFAQVADASFDALTFELWGALLHGGTVCVIDTDTLLTAGGLRAALRAERITAMFLTSALFTEIMSDHPDTFARLTTLLVGGDVLNIARVRRLVDSDPAHRPTRLLNGYGPTEATTFAVCHPIDTLAADATSVPIGRPIANTTGYVLDRYLEPVPAGVVGELFLGGPGVARGYAGRPGMTAQRFVPDPFAADGGRLYRTGDLVRYRGDGTLEYLGRVDSQVKIRGFRVEPGEVEAALDVCPGVAQSVVVADEVPAGRRLVAYVVAAEGHAVRAGELRDFLSVMLPPHLVPAVYVSISALPMTPSGKVDRAALPPAEDQRIEFADHRPPGTATEMELAELAESLLGLDRVGAGDDFFRLGGHSLLAMRLVARANELFATEVPLRVFLRAPTVAALAVEVDLARATAVAAGTSRKETDAALLARLDELSDDEVEELLRTMAESEADR